LTYFHFVWETGLEPVTSCIQSR